MTWFSVIRDALQDGAGAGEARYIYPRAWEALDALENFVGGWTIRATSPDGYGLIQPDGRTSGINYIGHDAFTRAEAEAARRNANRAANSHSRSDRP